MSSPPDPAQAPGDQPGLIDPRTLSALDAELAERVEGLFDAALEVSRPTPWADRFEGLRLVFVAGQRINARAYEDERGPAIAIAWSGIRGLWTLTQLAVGATTLLEGTFTTPPPEPAPDAAHLDLAAAPSDRRSTWPEDRVAYHEELFMYAADFLLHHELAHHARGHIDLLDASFGIGEVLESQALAPAANRPQRRMLQLIELDADIQALDLLLQADLARGFERLPPDHLQKHAYKLMLSTILVFQLLDFDHRPVVDDYLGPYPAPIHRAMMITQVVVKTFVEVFGLDADEMMTESEDAWAQTADVARALAFPSGRWWGLDDLTPYHPRLDVLNTDFVTFSQRLSAANEAETSLSE